MHALFTVNESVRLNIIQREDLRYVAFCMLVKHLTKFCIMVYLKNCLIRMYPVFDLPKKTLGGGS